MSTHRLTIELSEEGYAALREGRASAPETTESEWIEAAVHEAALRAREEGVPRELPGWLEQEVVAAAEELDQFPERGLTLAEVRAQLAEHRKSLADNR